MGLSDAGVAVQDERIEERARFLEGTAQRRVGHSVASPNHEAFESKRESFGLGVGWFFREARGAGWPCRCHCGADSARSRRGSLRRSLGFEERFVNTQEELSAQVVFFEQNCRESLDHVTLDPRVNKIVRHSERDFRGVFGRDADHP